MSSDQCLEEKPASSGLSYGIKVGKERRKMPGVKRLHQESEDVSKPEWIRGHYFSALGLLLNADKALFASLIVG